MNGNVLIVTPVQIQVQSFTSRCAFNFFCLSFLWKCYMCSAIYCFLISECFHFLLWKCSFLSYHSKKIIFGENMISWKFIFYVVHFVVTRLGYFYFVVLVTFYCCYSPMILILHFFYHLLCSAIYYFIWLITIIYWVDCCTTD